MAASTIGVLALVTLLSHALQQEAPSQILSRAHGHSRRGVHSQAAEVEPDRAPESDEDMDVGMLSPLLQSSPHPCGTGPCTADATPSAQLVSGNMALNFQSEGILS